MMIQYRKQKRVVCGQVMQKGLAEEVCAGVVRNEWELPGRGSQHWSDSAILPFTPIIGTCKGNPQMRCGTIMQGLTRGNPKINQNRTYRRTGESHLTRGNPKTKA